MKALIKQKPASQKEVFYQDSWLEFMDLNTGYPLNTYPYKYGLCEDAVSNNPDDYVITSKKIKGMIYYTATIREDYEPVIPDMTD